MIHRSLLKQVNKPAKYQLVENNPYLLLDNLVDIAILNLGSYESSISQINFQILYSIIADTTVFRPQRFFIPDDDFLSLTKEIDYQIESIDQQIPLNKFKTILCYLNNDESIIRFLKFKETYNLDQRYIIFQNSTMIHPLIKEYADTIVLGNDLFKFKAVLKDSKTESDITEQFAKMSHDKVVDLNQLTGFGSITKFIEPIINVMSNASIFSYIYNSFENNYNDLFKAQGTAANFSLLLQSQKRLNERILNKPNEGEIFLFPLGISARIRFYLNVQSCYRDIVQSVKKSLAIGWRTVHLFYWIGHPLETDEDKRILKKEIQSLEDYIADFKKITIQLHISPFVPAPKSEFLWDDLLTPLAYSKRKIEIEKLIENKADMFLHYENFSAYINRLLTLRADQEQISIFAREFKKYLISNNGIDQEQFYMDMIDQNIALQNLFESQAFDRGFPNIIGLTDSDLSVLKVKRQEISKALVEENISSDSDYNLNIIKKALPNLNIELRKTLDAAATVLSETEMTYGRSEKRRASQQQEFARKYRIHFSQKGAMSFYTYQDIRTLFLKLFEKIKLNIVMTKGFKPHPKIAFAAPTSIGVESDAEYFDVEINLIQTIDFIQVLNPHLPIEIEILDFIEIPLKYESLAASINLNVYKFDFTETEISSTDVQNWYNQSEIELERDSKNITLSLDMKSFIHEFSELNDQVFLIKLITLDNRLIKTDEILHSINKYHPFDIYKTNILRVHQFIYKNNEYLNPIQK